MPVLLFGAEFFGGEFLGGGEGVGGGNFYVGLDAGTFPICFADGIDGAGKGNANHEMSVNAMTGDRMGAASGGFANEGGTLEVLEVAAELFGAGKSLLGDEHIGGLSIQTLPGHVGERPILMGGIVLALPDIVQVGGL